MQASWCLGVVVGCAERRWSCWWKMLLLSDLQECVPTVPKARALEPARWQSCWGFWTGPSLLYMRACVKCMFCGFSWEKCLLCSYKELNVVTGWSFTVLLPFWDSEGLYMCFIYIYIYTHVYICTCTHTSIYILWYWGKKKDSLWDNNRYISKRIGGSANGT